MGICARTRLLDITYILMLSISNHYLIQKVLTLMCFFGWFRSLPLFRHSLFAFLFFFFAFIQFHSSCCCCCCVHILCDITHIFSMYEVSHLDDNSAYIQITYRSHWLSEWLSLMRKKIAFFFKVNKCAKKLKKFI